MHKPASGRLMIRDQWLNDNAGNSSAVINVKELTPSQAFITVNIPRDGDNGRFEPRMLSVNSDVDGAASGSPVIRGRYENDPTALDERFTIGVTHEVQMRYIHAQGTNARGIILKG